MKYFTLIFVFAGIAVTRGLPFGAIDPFDAEQSTKFKLLTPLNWRHPINFNLSFIPEGQFSKTRKTLIVIHGLNSKDYLTEIFAKACYEEGHNDIDLIGVDWTEGSNDPLYIHSAHRVKSVGKAVAKFIAKIIQKKLINVKKLELIGHSLGAMVAGFVGKYLDYEFNLQLPLIVGLDPAGPLFREFDNKLKGTDAEKVLVIHTSECYGHFEPFGSVDIYLNGGKKQPGLNNRESHRFAVDFYKGLINIKTHLIGYFFDSFDDVMNEEIDESRAVKLFHGEPLPHDGSLIFIDTYYTQKSLMPEFEKLNIDNEAESSSLIETANCNIM